MRRQAERSRALRRPVWRLALPSLWHIWHAWLLLLARAAQPFSESRLCLHSGCPGPSPAAFAAFLFRNFSMPVFDCRFPQLFHPIVGRAVPAWISLCLCSFASAFQFLAEGLETLAKSPPRDI
jgi:hypothetical protein